MEAIAALRRLRMTGPEIAETLEMATSTVSAVLKRIGLGKLSRLGAEEPIRRYERDAGQADGGHENLPIDGHRISPLADTKPPQWRPSDLPTEN